MKRNVPVKGILSDLRQGLSDEELMRKYRLSGDSLKTLLADLLRALANGSPDVEVEPEE